MSGLKRRTWSLTPLGVGALTGNPSEAWKALLEADQRLLKARGTPDEAAARADSEARRADFARTLEVQ